MLIGRARPVARLRKALGAAARGRGSLVLVTGEAGIGKTTLVAEVTTAADARVVGGACWADGAPSLWPWRQVVRALRGEFPVREDEFAVFAAVTDVLLEASCDRTLVVVLEDLHWADEASLRLLDFAVQHTGFARLLLVGTYRDDEALVTAKATTIALTGLTRAEVAALAEAPDNVVDEIVTRSGGNPFFVEQLARLWRGGSPISSIPPGVAAVVERRLSRLPAPAVEVLRNAAVLGHEFSFSLLRALGDPTCLEQAIAAGLVRSLGDGWFAFVHDLVRVTLHSGPKRHAAVVRAVRENPALDVLPAELAAHALAAGDELEAAEAARCLVIAAEDANRRFARAEAARHYRHALARTGDAETALGLGTVLHAMKDLPGSREAFRIAMADDDPVVRAKVALTLLLLDGTREPEQEEFVERARADIAVHQEMALPAGLPHAHDQTARELSGTATELARRSGDTELLELGLHSRLASTWGLGTAEERLAITDELLRFRDPATVAPWRILTLIELGDPRYLAEHQAFQRAAHDGPAVRQHEAAVCEAMIADLQGRYADARAAADRARELGEQPHFERMHLWWLQRWSIASHQGDHAEVAGLLAAMRADPPPFLPLLEGNRVESGRWLAPLSFRLEVDEAVRSGDRQRCALARRSLEPFAGQWAVTGSVVVEGPVDAWLARLDTALGDHASATRRWAAVTEAAQRLGATPWLANTFRRDGAVWELGFAGRTAHVPDSKGLRDLHVLLGNPGQDIAAATLAQGSPRPGIPSRPKVLTGSDKIGNLGADPVLDERARAAYRRRLAELDEQISSASDRAAAELDRERQALLDELRRATGLGGRPRRLGDDAERARKSVTNRINDALRRLDQQHPELARHLRDSVTTGAACAYRPAAPAAWKT